MEFSQETLFDPLQTSECQRLLSCWPIGKAAYVSGLATGEAASPYNKLDEIVKLFHQRSESYGEVMRTAIAINGSFFQTQRMVSQYLANAYFPADPLGPQCAIGIPVRASIAENSAFSDALSQARLAK